MVYDGLLPDPKQTLHSVLACTLSVGSFSSPHFATAYGDRLAHRQHHERAMSALLCEAHVGKTAEVSRRKEGPDLATLVSRVHTSPLAPFLNLQ